MDGDAVKELALRFRAPMVVEGNIAYPGDWKVVDPATIAGPQPEPLAVYTLGALRDYVKTNRDGLDLATVVVHVVSPQIVALQGALRETERVRETYVNATALNLTDGFLGKFMSIEEFIIGLQSRFLHADERTQVLKLFGTVKQETAKTATDDGITQTVTAKSGVALVTEVAVPNPVLLSPFRTFREVTQPQSPFVLRVQGGGHGGFPTVGLFEADGGAWRLTAVDRVRDWLAGALPSNVAVLA